MTKGENNKNNKNNNNNNCSKHASIFQSKTMQRDWGLDRLNNDYLLQMYVKRVKQKNKQTQTHYKTRMHK